MPVSPSSTDEVSEAADSLDTHTEAAGSQPEPTLDGQPIIPVADDSRTTDAAKRQPSPTDSRSNNSHFPERVFHQALMYQMARQEVIATLGPGVLEQSYATDPAKATDQMTSLIGETNSAIALHSMSDKSEGSANAPTKPGPTGFVILGVTLKLKSSSA